MNAKVTQFEDKLMEVYGELVTAKISRVTAQWKAQDLYRRLIVGDVEITVKLSFEIVTIMYDLGVELVSDDPLFYNAALMHGEKSIDFLDSTFCAKNPYVQSGEAIIGSQKFKDITNFLCGKTKADWERNDLEDMPTEQKQQNTKRFAIALI